MLLPLAGGRVARSRARSYLGQATVELALVLPLLFAMLVLLFQVSLVARDEIRSLFFRKNVLGALTNHVAARNPKQIFACSLEKYIAPFGGILPENLCGNIPNERIAKRTVSARLFLPPVW